MVSAEQAWLESIFQSLQPYVLPHSYQNWPDANLSDWKSAYYGSNLRRLTQVKSKYDPEDVFKYAQSVPLAA